MLESLISSRIRRALVEYIVTHPSDRFYLRGLAKSLDLAVSPLRRELKRLEQAGVLRPELEGNMLFYTVDTHSPVFVQLQQAAGAYVSGATPPSAGSQLSLDSMPHDTVSVAAATVPVLPQPKASNLSGASPLRGQAPGLFSPMTTPVLVGAAGVGTALVLVVAGLAYLSFGQKEFFTQTSRALKMKPADVTVVIPATSASGTMRGSRYQVVPGAFGGFSSGAGNESY